jgi:hypothetical protein
MIGGSIGKHFGSVFTVLVVISFVARGAKSNRWKGDVYRALALDVCDDIEIEVVVDCQKNVPKSDRECGEDEEKKEELDEVVFCVEYLGYARY